MESALSRDGTRQLPVVRRPTVVRPPQASRIFVRPIDRPYWELKHWHFKGNDLVGFYRTPYGSYEGYIKHPNCLRPEFYIVDPPVELRAHPHWICFHHIGGNRYSIHFSPPPPNPDAGIVEVEKVLAEALSRGRRRNA